MANVVLEAEPRTEFGKRVRFLRREGLLPANLFGRGRESVALQLKAHEFELLLKHQQLRGMVELTIDGKRHNVLVRHIQRKGGTGHPQHVDFYAVDLARAISLDVTLQYEGTAPAERELGAMIVQSLQAVTVECLPGNIPDHIVVDLSPLATLDDNIHVRDLVAPEGVTILTDPTIVIASVVRPSAEVEAEAEALEEAEEAAEAAEEAAPPEPQTSEE